MKCSTRPRVLHLFNTLGAGGMERQTLLLVQLLHESERFEVHVAVQSGGGPLAEEIAKIGLPEMPAFPLRRLYDVGALVQLRRFAAHLRRLRIDILHTHDFYTSTFGMPAALLAGVPVRVAARRELDAFTPRQRRVEHFAYRLASAVVANCERLRHQVILEGVPAERVVTISNAVDPRRVATPAGTSRQTLAAGLGLPAERRFVTMVANLYNREKDFTTLLTAAARVRLRFPEVVVVLAGDADPHERSRIERLAVSQGIADRVALLGRCDRVAELLALTEVGVLSSRSEGLSNSVLEYMAAGLPVVATDVGGIPEAVIDGVTGHLVPPGDPDALADRLISLLEDRPSAERMGREGRRRAERHFTPAALLSRTAELYERLLARGHSGRRR